MSHVEQSLTAVFDDLAARAPHDPDLVGTVRRRARRRRAGWIAAAAAAACASTAGVVAVGRAGFEDGDMRVVAGGNVPACDGRPITGVLPVWARAGFGAHEPVMPYVRSRSGRVLGILFGSWSPGENGRPRTKILWVWDDGPSAASLRVSAQRDGVGAVVTEGLPEPYGPSITELPTSGCWRLTFSSPTWSDTIDVDTRL